jgi:hypothetical protein
MTDVRRAAYRPLSLLLLLALPACELDCTGDLGNLYPNLTLSPERLELDVPVTANTEFGIDIVNNSNVPLNVVGAALSTDSDPNIVILEVPESVPARARASVRMSVRPLVTGTIEATLIVTAEETALPEPVAEAQIILHSIDLGLPDISVTPDEISFTDVGLFSAAQRTVTIRNSGIRDLIIDETRYVPDVEADRAIRLVTPIQPGWAISPGESVTTNIAFSPENTTPSSGHLLIRSNDPDELEVLVPITGQGVTCPIAVASLIDDGIELKPFDTVRLDGRESYTETPGTEIASYEWVIEQRPVGSTSTPKTPTMERTDLTLDLAGNYVVRLTVVDDRGVRSCNDAIVPLFAKPDADLHIQLVWDHPAADLDLHLLKEGGQPFTHEGDVYFSNRTPQWFAVAEQNPRLDVDDSGGYGPENINIGKPAPGSKWTVLVHYWNKQTDGDPFTIASVRIWAKGQQVVDVSQTFEEDQTMWTALEITWPLDELLLPTLTQVGLTSAYPRPF